MVETAMPLPLPHLLKRLSDATADCTQVNATCPVDQTIYGYYPNLGANAFFLALFAICLVVQTFLGLRNRMWTFLIAMFFGPFAEAVGYAGRIIMHNNPWSNTGFEMQICCLIIAPAFIAAGVYLTLKHTIIEIGPQFSRLPPRFYTWIFILCDLLSLIIQGAGGGLAASANGNATQQKTGNDLMMAGIVWQVVTLLVFGGLVADYAARVNRSRQQLSPTATALLQSGKFRFFVSMVGLAYITVFIRCVFRIAEMANGWANPIMQDEVDFIVLDGVMVSLATIALTVAHPALVFRPMIEHKLQGVTGAVKKSGEKGAGDIEEGSSPESPDGRQSYFGGSGRK